MITRKIKLLGVLVALLVVVSIGSAALVGYLSNTVHNDVEVTSPLEVSEFVVGDIVAGNTTCVELNVTNHANRNICGLMQVTVTNDTGALFDGDGINISGSMECGGEQTECIYADYKGDGVYQFDACICFAAEDVKDFEAKIYAHPLLAPDDYNFDTVVVPCGEYYGWNEGNCGCDEDDVEAMCEGHPCDCCLCEEWY